MGIKARNIIIAVLAVSLCVTILSLINKPDVKKIAVFDVPKILVHIKGAVAVPGLYELEASSRIADAIAAAGGALKNANTDAINLAQFLEDGEEVIIPMKNETVSYAYQAKVNINTADKNELCTLEGIGMDIAENIIAYREKRGSFYVKEELMNVPGIGQAKYEAVKDKICVK